MKKQQLNRSIARLVFMWVQFGIIDNVDQAVTALERLSGNETNPYMTGDITIA